MAINFPRGKAIQQHQGVPSDICIDEDEMLQIQGIEPDKVRRYSKKFLKLIRNHHDQYQSIKANKEDIRFDTPEDPNHEIITILSSDEDEFDNSDGGGPLEEHSPYFADPEVEAFNSQCRLCKIRRSS